MRTALRTAGVLAVALALTACSGAVGAVRPSTPASSPAETAVPVQEGVRSRQLELTDPTRATDPTPAQAGADATAGRVLPTTLYWPETGDGPFPLVVFSHGLDGTPASFYPLLQTWAAAGFVVAAPLFPLTSAGSPGVVEDVVNQPADVSFVISSVLELASTPGDELADRVDADRIAVAGHSLGAVTTLGLLTDFAADPRIGAAVLLAGTSAGQALPFAQPSVPVLFLHGTDDDTITLDDGRAVYAAAPAPKAFVELVGGGHNDPYADPSQPWHAVVEAVTTDFLRWAATGDPGALVALRAAAAVPGVATLAGDELPA
ncbi:alpha/beta hydrolase family protein [Geodermatophilus sp. SYSU D00815]